MPLPYTPYKLASASLAAPASLLSHASHEDEPIAVPTPQHPGLEDAFEGVGVPHHQAVDAKVFFPSAASPSAFDGGYVLARVVAAGRELQLRWSSLSQTHSRPSRMASSSAPDKASSSAGGFSAALNPRLSTEPARSFLFPAPLLPSLGIFADHSIGALYIIAVTTSGFLYRLSFSVPHLFHDANLSPGWSTEYRIQHLASNDSALAASLRGAANAAQVYAVDAGLVLVTCADGTVVKLSQSRTGRKSTWEGTWKENVLRPTSFFSGVSRFFGRSHALSDSDASPSYALALDVYQGDAGTTLAFAASRDRKLRVWNLLSDSCVRTLDLPLQMDTASSSSSAENQLVVAEDETASQGSSQDLQSYFSTVSRPLVKTFVPGQDDSDDYPLYVLAYVPASPPGGNFFALYGVELEESKSSSGGLGEMTLLWQKRCDIETRGRNVELRDVVFTPQGSSGEGWTMWALWDAGGEPLLKYAKVGVDSGNGDESFASIKTAVEDLSRDDWRTVNPERIFRPLHGEELEATLEATRSIVDPGQIFLERVLEPGRFSEATLRLALATYRDAVPSTSRQAGHSLFATLEDEVASTVASNCQLENDPKTGGPMYEKLYAAQLREWMRFVGLAEQIETSARWPVALGLAQAGDARHVGSASLVPLVVMREGIALPVIEDEASIIERVQRTSAAAALQSERLAPVAASELVRSERELLIHAADTHPTGILPLLGDTSATVVEVLTLLESASELTARFTAPELDAFASGLQGLLSQPLTVSMKEAVADIWDTHLADIAGEEAAQITDRVVSEIGASLDNALNDLVVLLSEVAGQTDKVLYESAIASTDLGSALAADALCQTIASRQRLAIGFVLLLSALAAHDRMSNLVSNESTQIAAALSVFQSIGAAALLARADGRVQVAPGSTDLAETDSIVAKLNQMSVAGRRSRQPHHFAAPTLLHRCIRDQLLAIDDEMAITLDASEPRAPSIQLKSAVLWSLWSLGITDARDSLAPGGQPLLPYVNERQASLAFAILVEGYPLSAEALLASFPESPASEYIRARALVQMDRLDEASTSFEKVVSALELSPSQRRMQRSDGLFSLLPSAVTEAEGEHRIAEYYRHVAAFFEPMEALGYVVKFCQASIDAVGTYADHGQTQTDAVQTADENQLSAPKEVWFKIFRCQLVMDDFEGAYATIMATPYEGVRKDCLRNLVSTMCEEGRIQPLLNFTFPGLQREVERTLSFKARNSDPLSMPNYYSVLYSYHIFRGDLKSAGAVMYQHAERLGEMHRAGSSGIDGLDALDHFMMLAVEQAQSYLASINVLTMLRPEHAWFAHAADSDPADTGDNGAGESLFASKRSVAASTASSKSSTLTRYIPAAAYSRQVKEIRVISVDDVRREYTLALARLELVKRYPDLAYSTTVLRPSDAVLLFVNSDSFDSSFSTAWTLGVDMTPIFTALTTKAVALSRAKLERDALNKSLGQKDGNEKEPEDVHPEIRELEDGDEDLLEPEAVFLSLSEKSASWEGPASERAWRYVQYHLQMYDNENDGRYYRAVLSHASALDVKVVPAWLKEWFSRTGNTDVLLRIWIKNNLVVEAGEFAVRWLESSTSQANTLKQSGSLHTSFHVVDTILVNLDSNAVAPSRKAEARKVKQALETAVKKHLDVLSARSKTLKRQAEQDAFRQEKRREQQQQQQLHGSGSNVNGLRAF
ncbi:hypothetical protein BCV70DRAFT_198803 [Testicularia cyperi]|uniref:Nuclear pore complex protein Nup160 n=1 Tax=Testicularia cyperi TaxID=1882483 RepID=A0A317XU88_9BASI|nr:hypothetical protein BCV70DRAFT_198803 [Testicularia cyperi]